MLSKTSVPSSWRTKYISTSETNQLTLFLESRS